MRPPPSRPPSTVAVANQARAPVRGLLLDQAVDVVLRSVLVVGHLEHTRHAQQGLLSFSVADNLDTHTHTQRLCPAVPLS